MHRLTSRVALSVHGILAGLLLGGSEYSLDTVRMFHRDAREAGFSLE